MRPVPTRMWQTRSVPMTERERRNPLLGTVSRDEAARVAAILAKETVSGLLLVAGTGCALVWANWPGSTSYQRFRDTRFGPASVHLQLSTGQWAADGLLAIFFFVAGLELKREFVGGDLRSPRRAAIPVAAAVGGMVVPALVYLAVTATSGAATNRGWAIPTATDIAFALAVLAVVSTHLPSALRTFLLTLAVVDDLIAITIIAVFYTTELKPAPLLWALLPLAAFAALVQGGRREWWLLLPLAAATWTLVHASGVHATVAGVLLGFAVPVRRHGPATAGPDQGPGLAEHFEHRFRPISSALAVPVFAFVSAGVAVGGLHGLRAAFTDRVCLGIIAALVLGKSAGILGTTYALARFTGAQLDEDLGWTDVAGLAVLSGIGFTVSLLIGELAFGTGTARDDHVKVGVLAGSLLAGTVATAILHRRNKRYRDLGSGGAGT